LNQIDVARRLYEEADSVGALTTPSAQALMTAYLRFGQLDAATRVASIPRSGDAQGRGIFARGGLGRCGTRNGAGAARARRRPPRRRSREV
jgi:hypothetical protein